MKRIDVVSLKGGVGKTSLAILLARHYARTAPALLIDADLTGTCLGDLLARGADWTEHRTLSHLVCGTPERVYEHLEADLPVYEAWDVPPVDLEPTRLQGRPTQNLLFCPSLSTARATAGLPEVNPALTHALMAHESAGGWISTVIELVVQRVEKILMGAGTQLGVVLVDHGPGLGPLQNALLRDPAQKGRILMVTSRDRVDLVETQRALAGFLDLEGRFLTVANRVPKAWGADWLDKVYDNDPPSTKFFDDLIIVREEDGFTENYARGDGLKLEALDLETLLEKL